MACFDNGKFLAPTPVRNWTEFERTYGAATDDNCAPEAVRHFFANGGQKAVVVRMEPIDDGNAIRRYEAGFAAMEDHDFNLVCLPATGHDADISPSIHALAAAFCEDRQALYLADAPSAWLEADDPVAAAIAESASLLPPSPNAALYFPFMNAPDPDDESRTRATPPAGAIAGLFARTDARRGVWTAPAGAEADLVGSTGPSLSISDARQATLNPLAVNCLRRSRGRTFVWGARTAAGRDGLSSQWRYISVRRLFLFIERSIARSLDWAVFEPNDENLWAAVRSAVTTFLQDLFRQGAFQGASPRESFFVRCDRTTMTQDDLESGRLVVSVGCAPLKPSEFVVVQIVKLVRPAERA